MISKTPTLFRYLLIPAWIGIIYWFSDQPNSNETTLELFGSFNYFVRKLAHMSEYAILFLLFYWAIAPRALPQNNHEEKEVNFNSRGIWIAIALTVLSAAGDEWHQSFVKGRSALFSDVVIDTAGASIAAVILRVSSRIRNTISKSKNSSS